jgi:excisionase family DNA binding protein
MTNNHAPDSPGLGHGDTPRSGHHAPMPHPLAALPSATPSATPTRRAPAPTAPDDGQDPQTAHFPTLPHGLTQLLFTAEQAAVLLAVRASWLRRAAAEGAIASTYLGKHLRFSHADLLAIIAAGARGYRPVPEDATPRTSAA